MTLSPKSKTPRKYPEIYEKILPVAFAAIALLVLVLIGIIFVVLFR